MELPSIGKLSLWQHSSLQDICVFTFKIGWSVEIEIRDVTKRKFVRLHNLDGILLNRWQYLPGSLEGEIRQAVMIITPHFVLKMLKGTLYKKTKIDEIFFPRMCQNRRVQFSNERTVVNYAKNYLTGEQKIWEIIIWTKNRHVGAV